MGIRSPVISSEPDRLGLPVLLADEAYPIGPAPSREGYLRGEAIVQLAKEIGADAIHPGYGFLSERAGFARLCRDAGIVFIGPSPEAIDAMGSKVESRRLMIAAGVPVVPGGKDPLPDLDSAAAAAEAIGYPGMLNAAAGVGYSNAGTCDFFFDRDGNFFFLEMNTRLQVEHPVTELVTGIDLVHTQIRVAEGEPLGPELDDVQPRGHAIEVRLYAEDPFQRFAPSPGKIEILRWPDGPGVRVDSGVYEGSEISIHYDPMVAKLIVWAADREEALNRLERALAELRVEGIRTTAPLFRALLADADFRSGNLDIGMLDRKLAAGDLKGLTDSALDDLPLIAAALAHSERANQT